MHRAYTRLRTAAAFTLVELLVVIGIIALLISILLPSLNSARQSAQTLKCLANLHSIGEGLAIYTGTSKGQLPEGYWNGATLPSITPTDAETDRATDWAILLTQTMGKGFGSYTTQKGSDKSQIQGMFTCPSAQFNDIAVESQPRKLHYTSHPRLMPDITANNDALRGFTVPLRPYKLSMISRSSEIVLIMDGSQINDAAHNYNANAVAINLDESGLYRTDGTGPGKQWNAFFTRAGMDLNQGIYVPNNETVYDIRFRHNKNTTANCLFVDGHAGSFRIKQGVASDATMSNFYVDRKY